MTATEDRLAQALGTAAARFSATPDLEATVARGRSLRRRQVRTTVAAAVVGVAAVAVVALQVQGSSDDSRAAGRTKATLVPISASPLSARGRSAYDSIGSDVFVWGGTATTVDASGHHVGTTSALLGDGAVFHASTNTWQVISRSPLKARQDAVAVTVGRRVLVLGGNTDPLIVNRDNNGLTSEVNLRSGAFYDVATDRWTTIPDAPVCTSEAAVVSGLVLAIGSDCQPDSHTVLASYDPGRSLWTVLATPTWTPVDMVAAPGGVVAYGVRTVGLQQIPVYSRFNVATRRWFALPKVPTLQSGDAVLAGDAGRVLAVARRSSSDSSAEVYALVADSWQRIGAFRASAGANLFPLADVRVTDDAGTLVLREENHLAWFSTATGKQGSVNVFGTDGSVNDPAPAPALAVGNSAYAVWGGRDLDVVPGTKRPLRNGVLITLP